MAASIVVRFTRDFCVRPGIVCSELHTDIVVWVWRLELRNLRRSDLRLAKGVPVRNSDVLPGAEVPLAWQEDCQGGVALGAR